MKYIPLKAGEPHYFVLVKLQWEPIQYFIVSINVATVYYFIHLSFSKYEKNRINELLVNYFASHLLSHLNNIHFLP